MIIGLFSTFIALSFKALIEYHSILSQFYFNFGKSCEIVK